ncbi:unnamed protein product [Boreogadus saida]
MDDEPEGAKSRISAVPLNANGRHLSTRPSRSWEWTEIPYPDGTLPGDDRRTRRTDVRIGIPGQHVRKDRGVPSGSRSPESFSCSFH